MNIILSLLVVAIIVALVLSYKYKRAEVKEDSVIDESPMPNEDENTKPEKPEIV